MSVYRLSWFESGVEMELFCNSGQEMAAKLDELLKSFSLVCVERIG